MSDILAIRLVQRFYDYLLDRHGILVGTFRSATYVVSLFVDALALYVGASTPVVGFWSVVWFLGVMLPIGYVLFLKGHVQENEKQQREEYDGLNLSALIQQTVFAFWARVVVMLIVFSLAYATNGYLKMISGTVFVMYLWSLAVTVRDREKVENFVMVEQE